MMGPEKLGAIRRKLRQVLTAKGEDPVRWLEERLADSERRGNASGEREVLGSLLRVLKTKPTTDVKLKQRTQTKK